MEQTTTIVNDKYDMENESKWKVTFKTKEVELKVKILSKTHLGILNILKKLEGILIQNKFNEGLYFIGNGRYRLIYVIDLNQTIQIKEIVNRSECINKENKSFMWNNIKIQSYTFKN